MSNFAEKAAIICPRANVCDKKTGITQSFLPELLNPNCPRSTNSLPTKPGTLYVLAGFQANRHCIIFCASADFTLSYFILVYFTILLSSKDKAYFI